MVTEGGAPLVFQLPHQPRGAELVAWEGEGGHVIFNSRLVEFL